MSNFKCDEIDDEVGETEPETPVSYWPPDQAMRLECLRLACQHGPSGDQTITARKFYNFVQGMADIKPAAN